MQRKNRKQKRDDCELQKVYIYITEKSIKENLANKENTKNSFIHQVFHIFFLFVN